MWLSFVKKLKLKSNSIGFNLTPLSVNDVIKFNVYGLHTDHLWTHLTRVIITTITIVVKVKLPILSRNRWHSIGFTILTILQIIQEILDLMFVIGIIFLLILFRTDYSNCFLLIIFKMTYVNNMLIIIYLRIYYIIREFKHWFYVILSTQIIRR